LLLEAANTNLKDIANNMKR